MNHNLYRAFEYILHYTDEKGIKWYFQRYNYQDTNDPIPFWIQASRKQAYRCIRFYKFLDELLDIYHASTDEGFWNLNVDCCFSNGAFVTVPISELLDKNGFRELSKIFPEYSNYRIQMFILNIGYRKRMKIFRAAIDNKRYKDYPLLLIIQSNDRRFSNDEQKAQLKSIDVDFIQLKSENNSYINYLFKNKCDTYFSLLKIKELTDQTLIIDLTKYYDSIAKAMVRDKNYNVKISSTV